MGKKNPFTGMTCDQLTAMRAKLTSGKAMHQLVSPDDFDFRKDIHDAFDEMSDAYRERWNRENPDYPLD